MKLSGLIASVFLLLAPELVLAAAVEGMQDFTTHWAGIICLIIFVFAYALVISEENIHMRKSKPVMVAAGVIWILVASAYVAVGDTETASTIIRHNLLEYGELFLFLLAAMTYINAMDERGIFDVLRAWLVNRGFSFKSIYWITGVLAFVISPIADNLTTALLMATVIMAVGGKYTMFVAIGCINIVVAANAGGAFSPFGDITTLMVWQKGKVEFTQFFALIVPSIVNWIIPAFIMSLKIPSQKPEAMNEKVELQHGAWFVVGLFMLTIFMAVSFHNFFHLPPVIGMMTGLGLLKLFGYYLNRRDRYFPHPADDDLGDTALSLETTDQGGYDPRHTMHYNIFKSLERAEWDTLMFFYGIILCVGGLGALGYLAKVSEIFYIDLGTTYANIFVGIASALLDNIPVMFAVLAMDPSMNLGQWLLVTLTAGVGGSMLSIGSAAGVAVMGQARGIYTFVAHLKWSWAIAIGYAASIAVHMIINKHLF